MKGSEKREISDEVEVLSTEWLREEKKGTLEKMVERYQEK